jgi:hypothetical protein
MYEEIVYKFQEEFRNILMFIHFVCFIKFPFQMKLSFLPLKI